MVMTANATIGQPVPPLDIRLTGGQNSRLADFRGNILVLYFYPRANTPGCTQEGQEFRDAQAAFAQRGAVILGASRDSLKVQESFKARQGFPFDLVADPEERLCALFHVIKLKTLYGKPVRGIERSTFLIDADGVLRREWRALKVKGHVAEVLAAVDLLSQA
jgi:thioredoxin-dependent peroxiredoxin